MWILRTDQGPVEVRHTALPGGGWSLHHGRVTYPVPGMRPGEAPEAWAGRVAGMLTVYQRLAGIHPLVPEGAGTAWARQTGGGPWLPVYGFYTRPGRPLSHLAEADALTLDLFWAVVPPVVELLRLAQQKGLVLRRLQPEAVLVHDGRPVAVAAPDAWDLKLPDQVHDHTRVAAHLIHWFLCALRQTPGSPELPSTLWAICARGLEGGYARTGLFRLEQDMQKAARRPLSAPGRQSRQVCLLLDVDGVHQATGAYLHPWRTLEALSAGQALEPLLAVHAEPVPESLAAAWKGAQFAAHRVDHFGPRSVADLVRSQVPPGQKVLLVTGNRDPHYTAEALQRAGFPCEVLGFRCETEQSVPDGMERLKAALYLAAGTVDTEESEGGLESAHESA